MQDFPIPNSDNIGGIFKFEFIPVLDVNYIPPAVDQKITESNILLHFGKSWKKGYATLAKGSLSIEPDQNAHGTIYRTRFNFSFPKGSAEMDAILESMEPHKFIIKILDNNGNKRLLGNLDIGMKFTSSHNSGSSPANLNGYQGSFFNTFNSRPPFLT